MAKDAARACMTALIVAAAGCSEGDDPCVGYCNAVLAADCGDRDAECAGECRDGIESWEDEGRACEAQFDAYLGCLADQSFHCENGITLPPADACASEEDALNGCLGIEDGLSL